MKEPSEEQDDSSKSSGRRRSNSYNLLPPEMAESSSSADEVPSNQSSAAESISSRAEFPAASRSVQGDDEPKGAVSGTDLTPESLRIVLVGKTGSGKSSSGNTILGRREFKAHASTSSLTQLCSKAESEVDGRHVAIVDTPGLFDTTLSNEEIYRETCKSISLLAPGPHAILLVLQISRFTKEEKDAVEYIKAAYGKDADKYIMILFTRGDDLEMDEKSIEDYIQTAGGPLKSLIADCGNRFHVFNNRENKDRTQVKELIQKIDKMVMKNGGRHYTSEMLQEAEEAIQKEKERILKEKDEEIKREMERIERKYKEEVEKLIQREKRLDEEKKLMEKKLQEMYEKKKSDQVSEEQQESEKREREQSEEWHKRKCAEELKQLSRRFEKDARAEAETRNSFLDSVVEAVSAGMAPVIKWLRL